MKQFTKTLFTLLTLLSTITCYAKKEIKIYLAGPEVFMPNPLEKGDWKKEIIQQINKTHLKNSNYKLIGLYPMDNNIEDFGHNPATAMKIFKANTDLMDAADVVIANMTRFRGPSMDVGTAFEMGYMYAQNKAVYGYYSEQETYCTDDQIQYTFFDCDRVETNIESLYMDKLIAFSDGLFITPNFSKTGRDKYTHSVENFDLSDNLMMVGAVHYKKRQKSNFHMARDFKSAVLNVVKDLLSEKRFIK